MPLPADLACPVLMLRVADNICAVPLVHVEEVMRRQPMTPLAGAPASVLGLAVIRGNPTPVVDLGALLHAGLPAKPADTARLVTLRTGERRVALQVAEVLTIRALAGAELAALPPLWQGSHPPAVAALGARDRELLIVLEAARLLPGESADEETA